MSGELHLLGSQQRKDMDLLEKIQRKDTKVIGMDHFSYEERLRGLGLLNLEKILE